jgi:hypothetical protein
LALLMTSVVPVGVMEFPPVEIEMLEILRAGFREAHGSNIINCCSLFFGHDIVKKVILVLKTKSNSG